DPDKVQGKISFWIFMASGLWRSALAGTILMFVLVTIDNPAGGAGGAGPPKKEFIEASLVALVGFVVSGLAVFRAVGMALWHSKKIWLDAGIHQARETDTW